MPLQRHKLFNILMCWPWRPPPLSSYFWWCDLNNSFFRPRVAAVSINTVSLSPSLSPSLSLSKNYSSYCVLISVVCVCVCVCVCVVTLSLVVVLNLGVQKISAITKVHSDNVRNIFLKLAEFNKFYLNFEFYQKSKY